MSTCRWCTLSGSGTTEFLKSYAAKRLPLEDFEGSNDDLCYCLECVVEYHKAREKLPRLHEDLWKLETSRLAAHMEKSMQEEAGDEDELYIMDVNGEMQLSGSVGPDFENNLRVPLLEILKYPYLLLHEKVSELCVDVLCKMEQNHSSFQVFEKYPGIYVFLVHPNEVIRRWAILTARNLGKVDRDDYYDLQEALSCLFRVIELKLFESPGSSSSSMIEKGKLILLPPHLYDTKNYKNYWLGICMLLTVLEEQAMDSLLLGPDKQNDFMQSILHTMEKGGADDATDPFWPALRCFMVILDQLGSKVWGQLIDPVEAFQTVINSVSYNSELRNIRRSFTRTKSEPESDHDDNMITCSQIVYNFNIEKPQKDSGWKTAICPDYCPSLYDDMQTLASVLQSDIGRDMRVHDSTFLWFIPFVQSLMDLKDLGVAYIVEVIHYLCSEIKGILQEKIQQCDKVSEFFLLILVSIIELHRNKKCLHLLWISSQEWVEAVVRCAKLPAVAFTRRTDRAPGHCVRGSAAAFQASNSVQHSCVQLIRSLLREGYQIGQHAACKQYLDKLNLLLRGNLSLGWQLNAQETQELQMCLKQVLRIIKDRASRTSGPGGNNASSPTLPAVSIKQERGASGERWKMSVCGRDDLASPFAVVSKEGGDEDCQENPFFRRKSAWEEESRESSTSPVSWICTEGLLVNIKEEPNDFTMVNIKEEPNDLTIEEYVFPQNSLAAKVCGKAQENKSSDLLAGKCDTDHQGFNPNAQCSDFRTGVELEKKCEAGPLSAQTRIGSLKHIHGSNVKESDQSPSSSSKLKGDAHRLGSLKSKIKKMEWPSKISELAKPHDLKNCTLATNECKGQISKAFCMDKTSANGSVPSSSENKMDVSRSSQIRPLSAKGESSDMLLKFSEYFKRQSSSVRKKEEDLPEVIPEDNPLTDSQVDRELGKLSLAAYAKSVNFPHESNQESSECHHVCDIKRKVRGAVRSSSDGHSTRAPCDSGCHDTEAIVISDSSDSEKEEPDKEETKKTEVVCLEKQPSASSLISESKAPSSPNSLEDCESQCFEFESEGDVFSVWSDTQAYNMEATQQYKQDHLATSVGSGNSDDVLCDHTNEWGYDLDYMSDDTMEEAANLIKKQVEETFNQKEGGDPKEVANSMLQESVSKGNAEQLENFADKGTVAKDFTLCSTAPRASTSNTSLASKLALKKNSAIPQENRAKPKVARTTQRSPKTSAAPTQPKKLLQSTLESPKAGRSMPAVIPPRKVRQCPAPASTVEKLGLKKAPRKAFELSQRSLESIDRLRSHGKAAGRVGVPQKRKTKEIAAQSLTIKYNKKFLACQDRQYLRQMRPQKSGKAKNAEGSSGRRNGVGQGDAKAIKRSKSFELASVEGPVGDQREKKREETHTSKKPSSLHSNRKAEDNAMMVPPLPVVSSLASTALVRDDKDEPSGKGCVVWPECEEATSKENVCKANETNEDDDLFLTQLDPVDMELSSDESEGAQCATSADEKPEEMDTAESLQQKESSAVMKCKYTDCMEQVGKPGECCSKHSATSSEADHLFAKPSLPPPSKPRKPSTTKIFSSPSSSRTAAFSKDLEDGKKLPPVSKSKVNAAKQVVARPPNAKVVPSGNPTWRSPSVSNIPQPPTSSNVLQPLNRQNNNVPSGARKPFQEANSSLGSQQLNDAFVHEVLNWTYETFANSSQLGPPISLLQSVLGAVPVQFQGYMDYFNTFFPLMMLNAFETLAQEWIENQKVKGRSYYLLCKMYTQDYLGGMSTAQFEAHFKDTDLAKQLHPKEDDLVFLVVQKKKDTFREESETEPRVVHHVGLVLRFCRASASSNRQKEQHTVYSIAVRTRGNFSCFLNEQVKCVVVGSLVTTHRMFKSLLLLNRSPLAKPIISPSYNYFCPRDLTLSSERDASCTNEYNADQKRAIETAYAMVKQHPGLPKICLIHGPPGTGKSKTIVGLLTRVLKENTRSERTIKKTNSKTKPNRFLVCAPSNAAVDELMKKIIIAFKEKCQNRQDPLGNCGDIKLVRIGAERAINSEVLAFSLDKQVEHRMKRKTADLERNIQKKKEAIDRRLDELIRQRAMNKCGKMEVSQMINDEFNSISKERENIASQLKELRAHSQRVQTEIILEADIICCTLSASGGCLLASTFSRKAVDPFSCVIVDEAGQSCEVETLIPLIHRCNKLVLVGDPRQLPPTVKSIKAQECGYDQSLMARLQEHLEEQVQVTGFRSLPIVQLTVQYRMHPDICLFPSNYVYGRTLKTDRATEENRCSSGWPFQPYLIFDVGDGREERDNDSFSNPQEVKLVMELIRTIKEKRKDLGLRHIGIITPYSAQKKKIQEQLDRVFRSNSPVEVDTVDAFQGREKDCIIVTCVRANTTKGSIGFLASLQRLNVTITRARFSLFILGRLKTLMENKDWNELIQDAHKRGAIIETSEENYRKDAVRILKRPPVWPP
ncbi:SETX helicase, partial [Alcedo cyanopectus]|nr:SETX helicase [Ceyx cyanopectus]